MFSTPHEIVNLIEVQLQVAVKLFKLILEFGRRYINDSYHISLYLNMGRIMRAEQELDEIQQEGQKLL